MFFCGIYFIYIECTYLNLHDHVFWGGFGSLYEMYFLLWMLVKMLENHYPTPLLSWPQTFSKRRNILQSLGKCSWSTCTGFGPTQQKRDRCHFSTRTTFQKQVWNDWNAACKSFPTAQSDFRIQRHMVTQCWKHWVRYGETEVLVLCLHQRPIVPPYFLGLHSPVSRIGGLN